MLAIGSLVILRGDSEPTLQRVDQERVLALTSGDGSAVALPVETYSSPDVRRMCHAWKCLSLVPRHK
eukprot:3187078-Amphidinium_carterae.1